MLIRRAELKDATGIAQVQVAAWRSAYRGLLPDDVLERLSIADSARRWQGRIAQHWGHIFVAEREGIVGFAACGENSDEDVDQEKVAELYVIYVHPAEWRKGHGRALWQEALRCLQKEGFEHVILWVLRGNERAISFYERLGFAADGASRIKRRSDGTEMPVVRYRRRVAPAYIIKETALDGDHANYVGHGKYVIEDSPLLKR